ncbi:MAG: pirin family protein [Verrucomicrobiota bacterium]
MQTTTDIHVRRANERFHSNHGWLNSFHTFSFGQHHDPNHMGFRSLRVINDDTVAPAQGFGTHPHSSMEIFSYVISGQLEHKDSLGNGRIIKAGEFQYMSAGDGIQHSEFNPSPNEPVHFLQIWLEPTHPGGEPRYADFDTKPLRSQNGLTLLASPSGKGPSFAIRQHAQISFGHLHPGKELTPHPTFPHQYLHLISGELQLDEQTLTPGDSAAFSHPVTLKANSEAEFLFFELS